ncbi:hypothetical protein B0H14DRAFT_3448432 [Mycena olivaceomarginata]|nr:hypothetical protein B0H14DRAFT_3448432 [Mycena olivaceomarginata]
MAAPPPRQHAHLRPGADVGISVSACLPAFPAETCALGAHRACILPHLRKAACDTFEQHEYAEDLGAAGTECTSNEAGRV